MTPELTAHDSIDTPELPRGWSWWSGNRGKKYYTRWFGTNYRMGGPLVGEHGLGGYEGQVYWDMGGKHHVEIVSIQGVDKHDDPIVSYPVISRSFDTEKGAVNAVPDLIDSLAD